LVGLKALAVALAVFRLLVAVQRSLPPFSTSTRRPISPVIVWTLAGLAGLTSALAGLDVSPQAASWVRLTLLTAEIVQICSLPSVDQAAPSLRPDFGPILRCAAVIWLWTQLDVRFYLGPLMLLGGLLATWLDRRFAPPELQSGRVKRLAAALGLS